MERFAPLERVDESRILSESERLLVSGDLHGFENFVHALETARQQYLERFVGRRKAIDMAVRAREVREELRQLKETFLPVFEQIVEKIFALNKDAATFNRTVSVAHLPQINSAAEDIRCFSARCQL